MVCVIKYNSIYSFCILTKLDYSAASPDKFKKFDKNIKIYYKRTAT